MKIAVQRHSMKMCNCISHGQQLQQSEN